MDNKRQLVFSILEFLHTCIEDGTIKSEDAESLEVATQCIGEAFDVDVTNSSQKEKLSIKPASLLQIFDLFVKTQKRTQQSTSSDSTSTKDKQVKQPTEEDKKKAEEFKAAGNLKVTQKNYTEAIKLYTQAIDLVADNSVYYANRAAAYSQLNDQDNAIADSLKSAEINPNYAKAYSRLGHAYFSKGDYIKATEAYEKAVKLEPNNANVNAALTNCRARVNSAASNSSLAETNSTERSANNPLSGAAGSGGDPMGGMDFASLMSNPMIRNMANQFMESGAMNDMMKDPSKMMDMAKQFMGGAGGAGGAGGSDPLAALMNNPEMAKLAEQFGGAMGKKGGDAADKK